MPLLEPLAERENETAGWRLCFRASEEEDLKWEQLDEMLVQGGPRFGTLVLDPGSAFSRIRFELKDDFTVMRWTRRDKDLQVQLNRTALKALTELRGLTAEGAGDYFLELQDGTKDPRNPVASDVGLHLDS